MGGIFSCLENADEVEEQQQRKTVKEEKSRSDRLPKFRRTNRSPDRGAREGSRNRESIHTAQDSHQAIRSSLDEFKEIKTQLFDWLVARQVPGDHSQTSAVSKLNRVFVEYRELWKDAEKLEDKITAKNTQIRSCEVEKSAADQEISRLKGTLADYQSRHMWEEAEKKRVAAAHTDALVILESKRTEQEERHEVTVRKLTSDHEHQLETQWNDHQFEVRDLNNNHRLVLENVVEQEGLKVKQAEEDMRLSVDNFQALQDAELKDRFYKLRKEVENFSSLLPAQDFSERAYALGINVEFPPGMQPRDHNLLLQSVLWAVIVEGVFSTPFRAFGRYGDPVYQTWMGLFDQSHSGRAGWPKAEALAEKWRYTTVGRLRRALSASGTRYNQDLQIQNSYDNNISTVRDQLASLLSSRSDGTYDLGIRLQKFLTKASEFATLLALERCRVHVFLPSALGPRTKRDPGERGDYQDVYPGDETKIPYGTAEFVVAPGLVKEGNSRGGKLEDRETLSKAKVYFSLVMDGNGIV